MQRTAFWDVISYALRGNLEVLCPSFLLAGRDDLVVDILVRDIITRNSDIPLMKCSESRIWCFSHIAMEDRKK